MLSGETEEGQTAAAARTPGGEPADARSIAVIGAGLGGVAAGVKLLQHGITDFVIYEKSESSGGVWWDNSYPGAEVDTATHSYSFSFKRWDWSRSHARRDEILAYLQSIIDDYSLREHMRLGVAVEEIEWRDEEQAYLVRTGEGERLHGAVISAVGLLNVPRYPDWPGLEDFQGPAFHTSRWEEHDLRGKRVAVVGTGSTAVQLVPELAKTAGHVYVFQREPGWIEPKGVRDYTPEERRSLSRPWRYRLERTRGFIALEKGRLFGRGPQWEGSKANINGQHRCLDFIEAELGDRPDLQKLITPDYPYLGKRPIRDDNFYRALRRDNVELIPRAVGAAQEDGLVDVDGMSYPVDVVVLATGFQAARYLSQYRVKGRGHVEIQESWAGEPRAFLGVAVPGYPNFFMLYGPNTNSPLILWALERQAEFAARTIRRMRRTGARSVEVRRSSYERYNQWLEQSLGRTVWAKTNNYFKVDTGKIVTQWPHGRLLYWFLTRALWRVAMRRR